MRLITGDKLSESTKQEVLNAYVYRWTIENKNRARRTGAPADHCFITDEQWLKEHAFYITNAGHRSRRHNHCESHYMAD